MFVRRGPVKPLPDDVGDHAELLLQNAAKAAFLDPQSPFGRESRRILRPQIVLRCSLGRTMPRIAEFFGMVVRHRGIEAVFALDGTLLEGDLGARAHRLVREWSIERAGEIRHAWECAAAGEEIPWVLPIQ